MKTPNDKSSPNRALAKFPSAECLDSSSSNCPRSVGRAAGRLRCQPVLQLLRPVSYQGADFDEPGSATFKPPPPECCQANVKMFRDFFFGQKVKHDFPPILG